MAELVGDEKSMSKCDSQYKRKPVLTNPLSNQAWV